MNKVNGYLEVNAKIWVGGIAAFGKGGAVDEVGVGTVHDGDLDIRTVLGTGAGDGTQESHAVVVARDFTANWVVEGVKEFVHLLLYFVCLWVFYIPTEKKVNGFL